MASDSVQICVGKGDAQKLFVAHKSILTRSAYFKKMLNGEWLEARTSIINMPEDDPTAIDLYLHLIYSEKLPESNKSSEEQCQDISQVYVLAEKLQDRATKKRLLWSVAL